MTPRWFPPPRPFIAYQIAPADRGALIEAFARAAPRGPQVIGWHVEALGAERPELTKALASAARNRATLILASLDDIAGDVMALAAIQQSGVEFVACDQPNVGRDALVELIASATSRPSFTERQNSAAPVQSVAVDPAARARAARSAKRQTASAPTRCAIAEIQRAGITSLRAIGRELAARGIRPPSGGTWQATQVARLRP